MRFTFALCLFFTAGSAMLSAVETRFPELDPPAMPEFTRRSQSVVRPAQTGRVGKQILIVNPAASKQPTVAQRDPATIARNPKATTQQLIQPRRVSTLPKQVDVEPAFSRPARANPPARKANTQTSSLEQLAPEAATATKKPQLPSPPTGNPSDQHIDVRPLSSRQQEPLKQQVAPPVSTRSAQDDGTAATHAATDVNSIDLISLMAADAGSGSPTALVTNLNVQPAEELPLTTNVNTGDVRFDSDVPQLRVRTVGPDTLIVGKSARYEITLNNKSNFDASDVEVRCSIPRWVKLDHYESTLGPVATQLQELAWSVQHVPARGEQKLTLDLTPTAGRSFDLHVDIAVQPAKTRKKITIQEPILALDVNGPGSVVYNETGQWKILLENPGTGDANDVVLDVHSGNRHLESEYLGTIRAGEKRIATLELNARSIGNHSLRTTVKGSLGLRDEQTSEFLCRRGELAIDVTGSEVEYAGTTSEYHVSIANNGNAIARNVLLSLDLPVGVQYVSGLTSPVVTERSVTWIANQLPVNETQKYAVQLKIHDGGNHKIIATASNTDDLTTTSSVVTQAMVSADLRLHVIDPVGPQGLGTTCEYGIEVVNQGTDTAREIEIIAVCAPELEAIDVEGNAHIKGGHIYFKPLTDLEADHKVSYVVRARATKPGTHTFRVIVKSYHPNMRLATEESTQFFDREVTFGNPDKETDPQVAPEKRQRDDGTGPDVNIEEFAKRRSAIVTQKTDDSERSY